MSVGGSAVRCLVRRSGTPPQRGQKCGTPRGWWCSCTQRPPPRNTPRKQARSIDLRSTKLATDVSHASVTIVLTYGGSFYHLKLWFLEGFCWQYLNGTHDFILWRWMFDTSEPDKPTLGPERAMDGRTIHDVDVRESTTSPVRLLAWPDISASCANGVFSSQLNSINSAVEQSINFKLTTRTEVFTLTWKFCAVKIYGCKIQMQTSGGYYMQGKWMAQVALCCQGAVHPQRMFASTLL